MERIYTKGHKWDIYIEEIYTKEIYMLKAVFYLLPFLILI